MCSGLEEALGCTLPKDMDSEEARLALIELVGGWEGGWVDRGWVDGWAVGE